MVLRKGGGGSFKDRKPVGEVNCCDSWTAERTDEPEGGWGADFLSLSISLSLYVSLSPSLCVWFSLSLYFFIYPSIYLPIYPSIFHPFIYPPFCLSIYLSVCLSICPDLLTSLTDMSPVLPRELHLCRSSSNVPRLPIVFAPGFAHFWQGAKSLPRYAKPHPNFKKWSDTISF